VTGAKTLTVQSDSDGPARIYLFGAGFTGHLRQPVAKGEADVQTMCDDVDRASGMQLTMVGTGQADATVSSVSLKANTPLTVTLSDSMVAGTQLCVLQTVNGTDTGSFLKSVQYFAPGQDYGRFTINFTGGALISNEQQSSNSSTASQYLDMGLAYTVARAGSANEKVRWWVRKHGPGLETFMNVRFTSVPVSATTNSSTTASGTTTLSQSLNVLSSQQSAAILLGGYAPFRLTRWYRSSNWITVAPTVYGGFYTLLNPTTSTASVAASSTVSSTTTSSFSSVYSFRGAGARFGWKYYPPSTDEAPHEFSWISLTLGNFSNLPSWLCTATSASNSTGAKYYKVTSQPTTACYAPADSMNSALYDLYASRKLVPRLDIAGELSLPSYPVVFGYDANVGQYSWRGNKIDSLNKPGNDVRFYFGLKFDVTSALSKLGVPTK